MRRRTMIARCWKLVAAVAILSVGVSAARADAAPRWKFTPGQSLNYVLERNVDGKMSLAGNEFGIKMGMTFDTTWTCKNVSDDGTANLEQRIDRIQIGMDSPLVGKVAYDSSVNEAPGGPVGAFMGPMIKGMLHQSFKLKVSPTGAVSDIELPAKLVEAFAKQAEVSQNRRGGLGIGGNAFDEKGIRQLIEQAVLPLPQTDDEDETWSREFETEIPFLGTEFAETTYSLDGSGTVEGKKLVKIAAETEVLFEPAEKPRAEMEIIEQNSSATALFDAEAGHMVKSDGTQLMVKEISGQQEVSQNLTESFKIYLGTSPASTPEVDERRKTESRPNPR
jgi:hypothetical protein